MLDWPDLSQKLFYCFCEQKFSCAIFGKDSNTLYGQEYMDSQSYSAFQFTPRATNILAVQHWQAVLSWRRTEASPCWNRPGYTIAYYDLIYNCLCLVQVFGKFWMKHACWCDGHSLVKSHCTQSGICYTSYITIVIFILASLAAFWSSS